jgi:hypothetical protein
VGFVADKVALGQVSSEYFGFPCHFSFHRLLHIHHHISSPLGTIAQLVADVPSGLSLTPPTKKLKKNYTASRNNAKNYTITASFHILSNALFIFTKSFDHSVTDLINMLPGNRSVNSPTHTLRQQHD